MLIIYSVLLFTHIISASVWVGGATMQEFVLYPSLKTISKIQAMPFARRVERRLTTMVWTMLVIGIGSGIALATFQGFIPNVLIKLFMSPDRLLFEPTTICLLIGMALTVEIVINGILITFYLEPRVNLIRFERMRRYLAFLVRLNNVLGITVIVFMTAFAQIPLI